MPVIVPNNLPAINILREENVFVMENNIAVHQDIRPLRIAIINIMPTKIATETHLLRLLTNSPLQVEVEFIQMKNHESKNTPKEHLQYFYKSFEEVKAKKIDGLILTGAPIEHLEFEDVNYWKELQEILDWSVDNVTSSLFICWGAQAGLYHFYGIPKFPLPSKMFGSYDHHIHNTKSPIVRGFDDGFMAPHSRHTEVRKSDIAKNPQLEIISTSPEAGIYLVVSKDNKRVFVTGHSEYDPTTLKDEYDRDIKKGLNIEVPKNYFPNDDPNKAPLVTWRSHANLLFLNWLNYYVYQLTPFDWLSEKLKTTEGYDI